MVNRLLFIYYALGSCTYMCQKFILLVPNPSNFIVCNSVCRYIYPCENKDGLFSDRLSNDLSMVFWCIAKVFKETRKIRHIKETRPEPTKFSFRMAGSKKMSETLIDTEIYTGSICVAIVFVYSPIKCQRVHP